jgi:hypothetical protein
MQVTFNPEKMIKNLTIFEKKDLPSMSVIALNRALFDTRKDLQDAAKRTFDRPVPYTLNSFLFKKARFGQPEALLFINESTAKGTPPAEYLLPQIIGGQYRPMRFQGALMRLNYTNAFGEGGTQILRRGEVMVPALGSRYVRKNKYGNMSPGQFVQIKSQLEGGVSSADVPQQGAQNKPQDAGPNTKYVVLDEESLRTHDYFINRGMTAAKPGIYFVRHTRKKKGDGYDKRYYRVMTKMPLTHPKLQMRDKFKFQDIAAINVEKNFVTQLSKILRERRG